MRWYYMNTRSLLREVVTWWCGGSIIFMCTLELLHAHVFEVMTCSARKQVQHVQMIQSDSYLVTSSFKQIYRRGLNNLTLWKKPAVCSSFKSPQDTGKNNSGTVLQLLQYGPTNISTASASFSPCPLLRNDMSGISATHRETKSEGLSLQLSKPLS